MKKKPSKLKRIVRDPNGPFRMRVVSDKKKYTRKIKHKNSAPVAQSDRASAF